MVIDSQDMLSVLEAFPAQCRNALTLSKGIVVSKDIGNVVVTGMGGSAIGGDLLKSYLAKTDLPVFVNRDYNIPNFVNENTLVFAVSYSGNTEETLSAVQQAKEKNAKIIGITSGGRLEKEVQTKIKVPTGFQPRAAICYLFFPMLGVLYNSGMIDVKNTDLNAMLKRLANFSYYREQGSKLAKVINGKTPIIYSSELLAPVAYRFKTQINENAKYPAFTGVFSEMNHNEINAFESMDRNKFVVLLLRDQQDHPRIKKRMDVCRDIISNRVNVEDVVVEGDSLLERMFSTIHLGDIASYELALLNRVDPSPVDVIEGLKKRLKE
ncbi:MAG: bifunctional phosphoglucose/phosphomannose isomerase [Nanoarchaeota archaeon]